jgi:hypothetical protein
MKHKFLLFAALLLMCINAFSQYESAYKARDDGTQKLENLIGKEFWIKVNPKAIRRLTFVNNVNAELDENDDFFVTADTKFKVVGYGKSRINTDYLRIEFSDGKVAYIQLPFGWSSDEEIIPNIFTGKKPYFDFEEYIFKKNPDAVIAEYKNKKAKAVADYKSKGGVKIGMTKDEVLKSNWGKPESVNKTTNAGSVREQWVYGGRNYLYFTNGILSGIQN